MLPPALIDLAALLLYLALDLLLEAVPLGVFVVSDESASTIAAGLNLLKSCHLGLFMVEGVKLVQN